MNEVLDEERVKWAVHGSYSGDSYLYQSGRRRHHARSVRCRRFIPRMIEKPLGKDVTGQVRMGLLVNGVDVNSGPSGTISATHGDEEMAMTVDAFRATVRAMKREGTIA